MTQQPQDLPHSLKLDEREKLTITGATEVLHFDEELSRLNTARGPIAVYGRELKLKTLSLEDGTVSITGQIDAIEYEAEKKSGGWGKLWR